MVIHDLSLIQVHSQVHATNRESNTPYWNYFIQKYSSPQYIHGLVQGCSISIASAMEILQSCTKPSICVRYSTVQWCHMSVMASKIISNWTVCSTAYQAYDKENIKVLWYWPFVKESISKLGIPHTKGQQMQTAFPCHDVTEKWDNLNNSKHSCHTGSRYCVINYT